MKDKKISKFRKWLIEKLGGYVYLPQPIILEDKRQAITLESTEIFSQEQFMYMCEHFPAYKEREIKESLWQRLGEQAIPYLTILKQEEKELGAVKYKARLTIVAEV
jgi:hypothetical protein